MPAELHMDGHTRRKAVTCAGVIINATQYLKEEKIKNPDLIPGNDYNKSCRLGWKLSDQKSPQEVEEYNDFELADSNNLTNLTNIYIDDSKKYGEAHDVLSSKLNIFYDYCDKLGILDAQFNSAFSTMLKGRAAKFYYNRKIGHDYDFPRMVELRHQENSILECFDIMIDELKKHQLGLSEQYQFEHCLRDQIVNSYQGV
ncbi:hypothetical protein HI914_00976 [Erysiphe necator]|nr:hypothetical protein HI914_00976 [Erysiphe necator]